VLERLVMELASEPRLRTSALAGAQYSALYSMDL
jgi:hypothetical protein